MQVKRLIIGSLFAASFVCAFDFNLASARMPFSRNQGQGYDDGRYNEGPSFAPGYDDGFQGGYYSSDNPGNYYGNYPDFGLNYSNPGYEVGYDSAPQAYAQPMQGDITYDYGDNQPSAGAYYGQQSPSSSSSMNRQYMGSSSQQDPNASNSQSPYGTTSSQPSARSYSSQQSRGAYSSQSSYGSQGSMSGQAMDQQANQPGTPMQR